MKTRIGFVSNSSSSSFIITNKTKRVLTLVDFVRENPQFIEYYIKQYREGDDNSGYTQKKLLESAEKTDIEFAPKEKKHCTFGDEDYTLIGCVFDYILRDGGSSKSFKWRLVECRGEKY